MKLPLSFSEPRQVMRLFLVLLAFVLVFPSLASAAPAPSPFQQPDLISIGAGYFDFDKTTQKFPQSGDMRFEYRWGVSLLPYLSQSFKTTDPYIQVHPFVGIEATNLGLLYGLGGFMMDGYIGRHIVVTWSEGAGFLESGTNYRMGSFLEFRSQAELGWRFSNGIRVTGALSHISNAKLTYRNSGAEIADIYLHIPVHSLF